MDKIISLYHFITKYNIRLLIYTIIVDIIADIGGTKSIFHVYHSNKMITKTYLSGDFKSFNVLLTDLIIELDLYSKIKNTRICLAIAAPIINNEAHLTNIGWIIKPEDIKKIIDTDDIYLINDLEAVGHYVAKTDILKYLQVKGGSFKRPTNTFLVIGIGTGFGMAIGRDKNENVKGYAQLEAAPPIDTSREYSIHATETGHSTFSPRSEFELEIFRDLMVKLGTVTIEDVCSSRGVHNIYKIMTKDEKDIEEIDHRKRIYQYKNPIKMIVKHSKGRLPCEICKYVIKQMTDILAHKLNDLTLEFLPYQGIFLFGGIIENIMSYIINDNFIKIYREININFDNELKSVDPNHLNNVKIIFGKTPIYVLTDNNAGLLGAKIYIDTIKNSNIN